MKNPIDFMNRECENTVIYPAINWKKSIKFIVCFLPMVSGKKNIEPPNRKPMKYQLITLAN